MKYKTHGLRSAYCINFFLHTCIECRKSLAGNFFSVARTCADLLSTTPQVAAAVLHDLGMAYQRAAMFQEAMHIQRLLVEMRHKACLLHMFALFLLPAPDASSV